MHPVLSRAKEVLIEVPRHGKLAYCLLRDPRVPTAPKAAVLGALALIVSPIDFPAWVPVLGELDMLALGVLAVKTFRTLSLRREKVRAGSPTGSGRAGRAGTRINRYRRARESAGDADQGC